MLILALFIICLTVVAGVIVWRAASRWWHTIVIAGVAVALFPLVATYLTGDVSRYLPSSLFSAGAQGKDEIVLASAFATIVASVALAAVSVWSAGAIATFTSRRTRY